jgi:predicted aspartyl protease
LGRLITSVTVTNATDAEASLRCDALVDTGASHMVLPSAWKERLGDLDLVGEGEFETATQERVRGEIRGPVKIQMEGFRPIYTEVVFLDMKPHDGTYDPMVGYIVLEQSQAAVDMLGHRLLHVPTLDLK